ncbi:MAG: hypothetical protein WCA49_20895 [Candidatus Sulfotelmatobacter sp.]
MNRFLGRILWFGPIFCVFAPSLPAQSSPVIDVAGIRLLTASAGQQTSPATNPERTEDSKDDPPSPAVSPKVEQPASNPSSPDLAPPPKRMFGMIPDFENTNDIPANRKPLTVQQKYILSLHQSFDISAHVGNAFQAGLQQAANGQPDYGQGWRGYGKRFAAAEGDQIQGSMLIYGFLPSILREDPRYFRQGRGAMFVRVWYAINRTFVTRTDKGTSRFNNSETFGQLISCGISTSYYPPQDRTVGKVFSNWGVNLGGNSAYNVLSEYYPDLMHGLFHRHARPVGPGGN